MADQIKIEVTIAGRSYPLRINVNEQERIDALVGRINECYDDLKKSYPLKDEQDYLAMTLLTLGHSSFNESPFPNQESIQEKLGNIESYLTNMEG